MCNFQFALSGLLRRLQLKSNRLFPLFSFLLLGANVSHTQSVVVTWNQNTETDVAGYRVYYGQISKNYDHTIDVNRNTKYAISSLPDTGLYYFAVTAYDLADNESNYSEEVSIHISQPRFFYGLQQNFPNPFPNPLNPMTLIPYHIPYKMRYKLVIYDLIGRRVKLLVEDEKEAGKYLAVWDAKDERNRPVATGTYICRLFSDGFYQTRKLMVLR